MERPDMETIQVVARRTKRNRSELICDALENTFSNWRSVTVR